MVLEHETFRISSHWAYDIEVQFRAPNLSGRCWEIYSAKTIIKQWKGCFNWWRWCLFVCESVAIRATRAARTQQLLATIDVCALRTCPLWTLIRGHATLLLRAS